MTAVETNEIDKRDIVTVNLKYGSSAKPLKTLAFAQLSAKALYWKGPLGVSGLAKEVAQLIGIKNVSEDLITKGLDYLLEINKVTNRSDKWNLRDDARVEIVKDLDASRYQIKGVLKRHFSTTVEEKKLKDWFKEAVTNFFGHYGDEWVSAISKGTNKKGFLKHKTIDELLSSSVKNHSLESIKQSLIESFVKFLSSDDNADQQYLMLISQAMFSARLVAADVGIDPITLQELRGAKFILDTNVIFPIALESSKLAKSINSLEDALKAIDASLLYLHATKEEYGRALSGKKAEIIHVASIYSNEVIKDVADDFIATAKTRGCCSKEDYERFFSALAAIPACLPCGLKLNLEDDNEIESVRKKAEADTTLKNRIKEYSTNMRPKWRGPKREPALNHDSTLWRVAEFIKCEGDKCWILSLDKSFQAFAINEAGPHGIPALLSVSALIEILAINNAGPELDATNFAPLLSKIILNECMPPFNTYIIQDLVTLHKMNEKAAELPPEDVKGIVREITRARIEGKLSSTALELKVNRMYQDSTLHITQKLEEARRVAEAAKDEARQERMKREASDKSMVLSKVGQLKQKALIKLILWLFGGTLLACAISTCIFLWYKKYFAHDSNKEIILYVSTAIPLVLEGWKLIPWAFSEYRKSCREADDTART